MGSTHSVQLVMMGLDNAGKSTALYRMKTGQYCETIPTIGFNCEKIRGRTAKTDRVTFTIWDVGGQERVRPLWRTYAKSAQGILFVLDSADSETLEEAKVELEQMIKYTDNPPIPILVLANKQDLPDAYDLSYLKSYLFTSDTKTKNHQQERLLNRPVEIVSVCAITGENLDEALELLYEMITRKPSKPSTASTVQSTIQSTSNSTSTTATSGGFASSSLSSSSSSTSSSAAPRSKLFNK